MAPPLKINDRVKREVLRYLSDGATMEIAARKARVTRRGLYRAMERDEQFRQDVDEARASVDDLVQAALCREAINGNVTAQIFWLKNRRRKEWRDVYDHSNVVTFESLVNESFGEDGPEIAAEVSGSDDK